MVLSRDGKRHAPYHPQLPSLHMTKWKMAGVFDILDLPQRQMNFAEKSRNTCIFRKIVVLSQRKTLRYMPVPRKIIFHKQYFLEFYVAQTADVRRKINQVLKFVETQEHIPQKFFRPIETVDGLFEIRVEMTGNIYRIFCCFDKGNLVVLFQGFQKKSQKTPADQIARAERLKQEYFSEKEVQ